MNPGFRPAKARTVPLLTLEFSTDQLNSLLDTTLGLFWYFRIENQA